MKTNAKNTESGRPETINLPDQWASAIAGLNQAYAHGLVLTITHTPGRHSHLALLDLTHGDFDFEQFNNEDETKPHYLANMCQRFTPDRFKLWKRAQIDAALQKFRDSPQTYADCIECAKAMPPTEIPPGFLK